METFEPDTEDTSNQDKQELQEWRWRIVREGIMIFVLLLAWVAAGWLLAILF
jgi:hypothetical protein